MPDCIVRTGRHHAVNQPQLFPAQYVAVPVAVRKDHEPETWLLMITRQ